MADGLRHRLALGTFGLSVLLHVSLFLGVSGWVLIQAVPPKITPMAADVSASQLELAPLPPEMTEDEETVSMPDANDPAPAEQQVTGMPADVVASSAINNSFVMPASVGVYVPGAVVKSGKAAGSGTGKGSASPRVVVGNIFNTAVESARLGVILDVSASGYKYLSPAILEVEKSFSDAIIVLAFGCGMYDDVADDQVEVLEYSRARLDPKRDAPDQWKTSTLRQIANAEVYFPEVKRVLKKMRSKKNAYYVYGGGAGATQFAFEFLLKEEVDTIYWFADFEDVIKPKAGQRVMQSFQGREVRVIAHDFSGRAKSMPFVRELVGKTGGKVIVGFPKEK
jgi:hypothetical protein